MCARARYGFRAGRYNNIYRFGCTIYNMMGNIIFKDIDDTASYTLLFTAGHRQYYMGQRRITHTVKIPVRRS